MAGMSPLTITKREREVMRRHFTILRDTGERITDVGYWGPADPTLIGARRTAGTMFLAAGGRYYVTDGDRNGASVHALEAGHYSRPERVGTLLIGATVDGWQALESEPRPRRRTTRKPAAASRPRKPAAAPVPVAPVAAPLEPVAPVAAPVPTLEPVAPVAAPLEPVAAGLSPRRQANRELAAAMRAAGLEPRGEPWRVARAHGLAAAVQQYGSGAA